MMRRSLFSLLLLVLLGAAAPAKDWRSVAEESQAGWSFGKPDAPLLVEYASFGCPHCGLYARDAGPAIDSAVEAGKLRFSWRPFLIFPHDRAATVLTRCLPAAQRLSFIKAVMAAQADTKATLAAADASDEKRQRLFEAQLAGPEAEALVLAEQSGLVELASRHGLARTAANSCLSDARHHNWVSGANTAARLDGIKHTPTFAYRGKLLGQDLTPAQLVTILPR